MNTQTATVAPARRAPKPKLTLTERKLVEMLTENTGRNMLDSGDHYGRHWQANQGRNFKAEPAGTLEFRAGYGEFEVTLNVFHWLAERLEYDPAMTARFTRFAQRKENKDSAYLPLMEDFALSIRHGKGIYGDGKPFTVNTYDGEDLLSQTIQYVYWTECDDNFGDRRAFVLLQIHGGCDVRGGYTAPKVFEVTGNLTGDDTSIFDNAKAEIIEELPEHLANGRQGDLPGIGEPVSSPFWYTDDGYHWYRDGSTAGRQLEEYEMSNDPADKGNGKIYVDADGIGYGPVYGGKLRVFAV